MTYEPESWIGDDDDSRLADTVAGALHALHAHGVPVFFMHGNRDFLLGNTYAQRAGMTLLDDPQVIDLDGERVLIMHGDTLCTDDVEYQKFRTLVRDPCWQAQFLARPLGERRAFAAQARGESRKHTAAARRDHVDVNPAAVVAAMRCSRAPDYPRPHAPPGCIVWVLIAKPPSASCSATGRAGSIAWPRPSAAR